ncbi:hypothetical protein [Lyngbya aestuarii]|uniref:hypothetical protein n=1 Tax=Lyngbya aestuarii TaxID=118322 RepID=UPI00403DA856
MVDWEQGRQGEQGGKVLLISGMNLASEQDANTIRPLIPRQCERLAHDGITVQIIHRLSNTG